MDCNQSSTVTIPISELPLGLLYRQSKTKFLIISFKKKLCISIIFRIFIVKIKLLQETISMDNFYAKYAKILDICKLFSKNLVDVSLRHVEKKHENIQ